MSVTKELRAAQKKAWALANKDKMTESRTRFNRKRKVAVGRICSDCGKRDKDSYWSDKIDQCIGCNLREWKNGRCSVCHTVKRRDPPKRTFLRRHFKATGEVRFRVGPPRKYCPECRELGHGKRSKSDRAARNRVVMVNDGYAGDKILTVWDILWQAGPDPGNELFGPRTLDRYYFTWEDVAKATGSKQATAQRYLDRLRPWIRGLKVGASGEGAQKILVFNLRRLRERVRGMVEAMTST